MATANSENNTSNAIAPPPVLRETKYDLTTAGMIAVVLGLVSFFIWLTAVWATNRPPEVEQTVPVEIVDLPGGTEEGTIDETLQVESPADVSDDPSMAEFESDETEVAEMLDNVLDLAETANNQAQEQFEQDIRNAGKPGSSIGTGRRALGTGPGEGGIPREQRWFIAFAEGGTLNQYARQLDHFGIELGALLPGGKLILLNELSSEKPQSREVTDGASEKRLFMTWQGGALKSGDIQLFRRAGYDVTGAIIFHFYPPKTEQQLVKLEQEAAKRPVSQIRRTYFVVQNLRNQFSLVVTRQIFF